MIKNLKILRILYRAFGFRFKHAGIIIFRIFVSTVMHITFFLDSIFFSRVKLQKLDDPVFLIGHLRSGTTFVHRFMVKNCNDLKGFALWEMVFPSLTMRKIIKPVLNMINNISFDAVYDPKIHKTSLKSMETDDIALSFRFFDGLLSWIYFYCWEEFESDEQFEKELIEISRQKKFVKYLKSVYQKNVFKTGRRMFSKSFSLLFNIDEIEKVFENPAILFIIRDPKETVPSMMSLEKKVQESLNNFSRQPQHLQERYFKNLYNTSLVYYRKFHEAVQKKSNDRNVILITHRQLMTDFDNTFEKIVLTLKIKKDDALLKALKEQSQKQQDFKTEHIYSLEQFGLTEQQIENDFAFIYESYDV